MKKYLFCLIQILAVHQVFAQGSYIDNNNVKLKKTEQALAFVINQSIYIVEAFFIKTNDFYYIKEDDQTYWRTFMKVTKVIRGSNLNVGDTIISIWRQEYKGEGPDDIGMSHSAEPRLWYVKNSTSCLFLTTSKFPTEPVPDQWSHLLKTTYIPSSIGYFAAIYDSYMGFREAKVAVSVEGLYFNYRSEWYDYLRKFKNINLPKKH